MPEPRSATPAPRRAITRWASGSPPPPPPSWATATPSSIVRARWSSRTTCAPRSRRSMPPSWSARRTRRSCRSCRSSCASSRISAFRAFCFSTRSTAPTSASARRWRRCSRRRAMPLVLRQIPIWNGDLIAGFVDLALERAFVYREHKPSEVVALEGGDLDREKEARFSMLEKLADHDDALMEQLLEDIQPPRDAVFDDLARELREGLICPVLLGSARARERRAAADEGAAPRSARRHRDGEAARRVVAEGRAGLCVQDAASAARRQAVADAAARRPPRRRRDAAVVIAASPAGCPASRASAARHDSKRPAAEAGDTVALGKLDGDQDRRHAVERQDRADGAARRRADAAGAGAVAVGRRPQGRRQARPGAAAAERGGSRR